MKLDKYITKQYHILECGYIVTKYIYKGTKESIMFAILYAIIYQQKHCMKGEYPKLTKKEIISKSKPRKTYTIYLCESSSDFYHMIVPDEMYQSIKQFEIKNENI